MVSSYSLLGDMLSLEGQNDEVGNKKENGFGTTTC